MSDKPNFVVAVGKLGNLVFRNGSYGDYATFSIKQGKHYTNCIASGLITNALKMAKEDAKVMAYGVQKEKSYRAKDGTDKISISLNVYAITLEAIDKTAVETVDNSQVFNDEDSKTKMFGDIEVSMDESDVPF